MTTIRMRKKDLKLMIENLLIEGNYVDDGDYKYKKDGEDIFIIKSPKNSKVTEKYPIKVKMGTSAYNAISSKFGSDEDSFDFDLINPIISMALKSSEFLGIPIYIVGMLEFLRGRTDPWTEDEMSEKYQKVLAGMSKAALRMYGGNVGGNRDAYERKYDALAKAVGKAAPKNSPYTGFTPMGKTVVEEFMYFLGQFKVRQEGSDYVITDHYDFNEYHNNPEYYNWFSGKNKFTEKLQKSLEKIADKKTPKSVYDLIRSMITFRMGTGYKGYPVQIRIPKSLADDLNFGGKVAAKDEEPSMIDSAIETGKDYAQKAYDYFMTE